VWFALALIAIPALALLGLETYIAVATVPQLARNSEQVTRTFDFISTAQSLQRSMQDAERGQRGFLITSEPAYLAPYHKAVAEIPGLLQRFRDLSGRDPDAQRRGSELGHAIVLKLDELRSTLELYATRGPETARALVRSNVGRDAMDSVTALIDGAIAAQSFALTDQIARGAADERRIATLTKIGGALALATMALGAIMGWISLRNTLRAETARHETEERFRQFVEGVTDYALYMLDADGNVASWNAGAQRIKGYTAAEIIGRHFSIFYAPEDRARGAPAAALAVARSGKYEAEAWRVRKSGERFFANVVINPVHDAAGKLVGYAKITRDISERLAQTQALEQARAELVQAQKMEALGQLSGGVAHDFNNVLHVINNAVAILTRTVGNTAPEVQRCLDMIRRNADRASALTQRLLAFSRTQALDPKPVDPNALVAGMADLLRQTLGERVQIVTLLGHDVWPVLVDSNQLETAIVNLAVNARDAMPDGGSLRISTSNAALGVEFARQHADVEPGDYAVISVADTGFGMAPEIRAKVFEPFFTTKAPGHGTGLGLSQVFGFIKQSKGHVTIESVVSQGTTVRLYLPRRPTVVEADGNAKEVLPVT
jgi:PAS domain S-box-containing protein